MKIKKTINIINIMYYVKEMVFISPCRKFLIKLCIYAFIFGISFLIFWIPYIIINGNNMLFENRQNRFPTDLKYILMWKSQKTYPFYRHSKLPEGQNEFIKQRCQFINCYITYNKYLLRGKHQNLDAVVFNVEDIINHTPEDFYLTRSPDQMYIFHSLHSSGKYPICSSFYDKFFNWTRTYKLNSDLPQPLIKIYSNKGELVGPKRNISWVLKMSKNCQIDKKSIKKTNAIAWLVPRCATKVKYQDFIQELISELKGYNYSLDLYGPCGNKKCGGSLAKCYKMIEKKYFFQLVLEDSLAEDYVSERMVNALSHIVIPVILGISDYRSFLPPGSYINAQSFDMKKIGAIFYYLIRYPETYYHFFDWKNHYYYTIRPRSEICGLCAKLNSNYTNISSSKVYNEFRKWWNPDYRDACQQMSRNNMFQTD